MTPKTQSSFKRFGNTVTIRLACAFPAVAPVTESRLFLILPDGMRLNLSSRYHYFAVAASGTVPGNPFFYFI